MTGDRPRSDVSDVYFHDFYAGGHRESYGTSRHSRHYKPLNWENAKETSE